MSILGRFVKFAGPVGIAVWIGTIIAKSDSLKKKLGGVWDSMKEVWSSLVGAFKEIGTALKPLAPVAKGAGKAFGFVFGLLDKIAGLAIGLVLDTIIYAFKSLANVIKGAGSIIAGLINVLVGLFTLDFGKVWDGLKQMFSGIGPLLKGAFGLFITFFAPAKLLKIGMGAIKGLAGGLAKAMPGVLLAIGKFLVSILKFFITLPFKLLKLGGDAIVALGKAVVKYAPKVLAAVGRLVMGVLRWIGRLPGRLLDLGIKAITKLGGAVQKGTPKVLSSAGRIFTGVVNWIAKLPGRLLDLGGQAVTKLGSAIRSGIGTLKDIAGNIVTAVVDIIKGLPGKLLNLGGDLLSAGKTLGGKILEGIRNGISAIGDMASSVASDLKAGINSAIGLPKSLEFSVLGKKIGFTIPGFEKGGIAPGGLALVGEGGPELVNLPRGSRVHTNAESKKMMNGGMPSTLILRVGARDFVAYLEEVADNRINAADNLAWQGA
jgi:phage-related protein